MAVTTAEPVHVSSDLWRNRSYPTRFIPDLPRQVKLTDHVTLTLDYGRTSDTKVCRDLVSTAAQQGDNVGVDEYSNEEELEELLYLSEMFVLKDPTNASEVRAVILISLPNYGRTFDPCLTEIRVFRSRDLMMDDVLYGSLVDVAERLVIQLDTGYTQSMVCMADSCNGMMRQLRLRNFYTVVTVPNSVDMIKDGLRDNVVMVKHLGLPDRKPRSTTEVQSVMESILSKRAEEEKSLPEFPRVPKSSTQPEFPRVPFLPQEYAFGAETRATFRNIEAHEFPLFYRMFKEMMKRGKGYGKHEFPTYNYFFSFVLTKSFCVFIEDKQTKKIISLAIVGDSCYTRRSQTRTFADSSFGVMEEYQNCGLGGAIIEALDGLCLQLGYEVMLNDYFATNHKMATITQKRGALVLGVIPKGGYVEGYGWDDQVVFCAFLRQIARPFSILAEESLQMHREVGSTKLSRL